MAMELDDFIQRRKERIEKKRRDKKDSYRKVYNELINCPLCRGRYDAENGSKDFMYGIDTVMENIAYQAGGSELMDEFGTMFYNNMSYSEQKVIEKEKRVFVKKIAIVGSTALALGCVTAGLLLKVKDR